MSVNFLGIDMGGTMVKAAIFDQNGTQLAVAAAATVLLTPRPGFTERDMEEFYDKVCAVAKEAVASARGNSSSIAGVSCTGHGKGLYLWGQNDVPARNGIISTDSRAADYLADWRRSGIEQKAFAHTCQSIHVSQPCALLRWVKDNEPEVYSNIRWVFEAKDYIRFRLTGEAFAELTDYSGTSLLSLKTCSFEPRLFELFNIPEMIDKMPTLKGSFDLCGRITADAAARTGIPQGTPVAGGMFDIDACALAMNILDEDHLCAIAGTWGINEYISRTPVLDGSVARNSFYCVPDYYLIEESSPTSAGNLEWLVKNILDEDRAKAKNRGVSLYQQLDKLVEQLPPEQCGVYFLPFVFGGTDNPLSKGSFVGFSAGDGKAQMVRAVFEGVVYCHNTHIRRLLASRSENRPLSIRLGGGAARSRVWVQMFADITGLPVEVVEVEELGTLGCAINAAVACGFYPGIVSAVEAMTRRTAVVYPNPAKQKVYARKFQAYQRLVATLDPFWSVLGEVMEW